MEEEELGFQEVSGMEPNLGDWSIGTRRPNRLALQDLKGYCTDVQQ